MAQMYKIRARVNIDLFYQVPHVAVKTVGCIPRVVAARPWEICCE